MPITYIDKKKRDDKQLEELINESRTDEKIIITSDAVINAGVLENTHKNLPTDENIEDYKDFLISIGKPGAYSAKDEDYQKAIGVYKTYHILIKHTPYNIFPKIKEPVTQTWKDENGDDVWLPRTTQNVEVKTNIDRNLLVNDTTNERIIIDGYNLTKDMLYNVRIVDTDGTVVTLLDKESGADDIHAVSYINHQTIINYGTTPIPGTPYVTYTKIKTEYVPLDLHEAFDFEISFVYYRKNPSDFGEMTKVITDFINAIKGRWLRIYDEYTGIGYDGVYLDSTDSDPRFKKRSYDLAEFSLTFRVNGTLTTVPFKTM